MKTSRVVIEIDIEKRLPKRVLEQMVIHFVGMKTELLAPFKHHDSDMRCRVYYEDFAGVPQFSLFDALFRRKK